MSTKQITLCADDYGYNNAVSHAILDLIQNKRINATSCMVNMPHWSHYAEQIKPLADKAQIGLHINLTEGDDAMPLRKLLLRCLLGRVPYELVSRRIEQQFVCFFETMGRAPDFIDGHQHIHQLPGIRDVVIRCYEKYIKNPNCWVRLSGNSINKIFLLPFPQKQLLIYWTGYRALKQRLKINKIPTNSSFAGVYDFDQHRQYRDYFLQFLQRTDNNGLIMCHPGQTNHQTPCTDDIASSRVSEYAYFKSEQFLQDMLPHQSL